MTYLIYDYVNDLGQNEFKDWSLGLQKIHRAKLDEKINKLELYGQDLYPQLLTDSGIRGVQKMRITSAKVQLRPLLCRGPIDFSQEYTLLMGAKEIGDKWSPKDAPKIAGTKKDKIIANPNNMRTKHEKIV